MTSRTLRYAILPFAALAALSCSKTQDTAPERRVFGNPPTIETVDPNFFNPASFISCDFSEVVALQLCVLAQEEGFTINPAEIQFVPGGGYLGRDKDTFEPIENPIPSDEGGVFGEGTYGEAIFRARVTDAESKVDAEGHITESNILLVSASFLEPDPSAGGDPLETSLVLFDDGSLSKFANSQKVLLAEDCSVDDTGSCVCALAKHNVTSGDGTGADGLYTRKMAFHKRNSNPFLQDCIMRDRQENLKMVPIGAKLDFKIEAVDRQGNLTTYPQTLSLTTIDDDFKCNGDPCGCCYLVSGGLQGECVDLPGFIVPDLAPGGLCMDLL